MGPSPLSDGMFPGTNPNVFGQFASMGPSPLSDGMIVASLAPLRARVASMGPSPLSDGMCTARSRTRPKPTPLQWGRRLSATEWTRDQPPASFDQIASMGPSPLSDGMAASVVKTESATALQWGRRLSATECRPAGQPASRPRRSFNGAVASQRRNAPRHAL